MWEESNWENHVQHGLIRFNLSGQTELQNNKSYLQSTSEQDEYNYIQIDY